MFSNYRGYLNHLGDLLKYNSGPHPQSCQHSRSGAGLRIYIANMFPDDEDFASPGTTLGESLNNSKPHKWIRSLHCSPPWPARLQVQQHLMLGAICVQTGSLHHPRAVLTADIPGLDTSGPVNWVSAALVPSNWGPALVCHDCAP